MSKVEGGGGPIESPPLKASCNYFFFEASRVKFFFVLLLHFFLPAGRVAAYL